MITLTTEQAQQIEETLEDIVRVFKFETGTPVEALAVIRAARAQGQAEQDLDTCPGCGGVADNGHDREFPPNPYYCTKCIEQAEQEPVAWLYDWEHEGEIVTGWVTQDFETTKFNNGHNVRPLYAAPQPDYKALWEQMCKRCDELDLELAKYTEPAQQAEQEPVAIVKVQKIEGGPAFHYIDCQHLPPDTKLYLAPVRTKDLTDTPENGELERLHGYID